MNPFKHMTGESLDENAILRARVIELERAELERHEAEQALRESRARLRTVVSNAPIVLFALDKNGVFTLSEGKALETIGYKPGQVVGQSVFDIYRENPQVVSECRRAIQGEAFATVLELPDAAFETRYTPLRDAAGEVSGCIGVATDITHRIRAEKHLRESEERFRLLAENIPGVIYLCENNERFSMTYLNDAVERLTGFNKDLFLTDRLSIAELIHPADLPHVYQAVNQAIAERKTFHLIYRLRRVFDDYIWVEEHGVGVFVDGSLKYLEGYITDITERIVNEQALELAKRDLERRVEERTARLRAANEKTLRTQEQLAHVLRVATVGEMASGLAHELNQPLSAITNYIQGTKLRAAAGLISHKDIMGVFEKVAAQAERAANILRSVRRYINRRTTSGSECDLNAVVRSTVQLAELDIREHQVAVQLSLLESLPTVEGDSVQLEQVILNLIRNGIEAMESHASHPRVLQLSTRMHSDSEVEVIIQDSGPGLADEIAAQVFQPFITTKSNGLGMGLSISRSIVEAHHGRIWLAPTEPMTGAKPLSSDGSPQTISGAEFHFTIPVRRKIS